jgi:Zn-dependent protease
MLFSLLTNGASRIAIVYFLVSLPVVLFSLSVHEASHAFISYKLGDSTARNFGRITLNPLKHLDPFGFICMLLFGFGWAKPVPINARNFKNARRGMAFSAAAGPLSNLILAFINILFLVLSYRFLWQNFSGGKYEMIVRLIMMLFYIGLELNTALAVFNLLPVPPLDGSRLFYIFLPPKLYFGVMKYERYIMIGVMLLLFLGPLDFVISSVTEILMRGMLFVTGINTETYYHILGVIFNF